MNRTTVIVLIVIGFFVLFWLVAAALVAAFFFVMGEFQSSFTPFDPTYYDMEPEILAGEGLMESEIFYSTAGVDFSESYFYVGWVMDMEWADCHADEGMEIAVAGDEGALILDAEGRLLQEITYAEVADRVRILNADSDRNLEFFNTNAWDLGPWLCDHDGSLLWYYEPEDNMTVQHLAGGNLDGNDEGDFLAIVDYLNLHLLDAQGQVTDSRKVTMAWTATLADVDGDGTDEILTVDDNRSVVTMDGDGNVMHTAAVGYAGTAIALLPWPNRDGTPALLQANQDRFQVFDLDGNLLQEFPAAEHGETGQPQATWARLDESGSEYLCVLMSGDDVMNSVLFVYTADGRLLYQEVMPDDGEGVLAIPARHSDPSDENLLVGGLERVWIYRPTGLLERAAKEPPAAVTNG